MKHRSMTKQIHRNRLASLELDSFTDLTPAQLDAVVGAGSPDGDICRAGSSTFYGTLGAVAGSLIAPPFGTIVGGAAGTFAGSLIGSRSCNP